jgi:hypothetical protein
VDGSIAPKLSNSEMSDDPLVAIVAIMFASLLTNGADAASWCAQYGTGGTNCGFHPFEKCLAARSGNGGIRKQVPSGCLFCIVVK